MTDFRLGYMFELRIDSRIQSLKHSDESDNEMNVTNVTNADGS